MIKDNDLIFDILRNSDDYLKLKSRYPEMEDSDLIFALFSIGLVASRNMLFRGLFEDIVEKGLKD